ncbi:hypothetical protein KZO01_21060 [Kurthia zopfii]|nr:hypothetical protein DF281_09620 [Kurthia zopfii]GEK31797.1 hypothetical protein KZO01_21060 [Kurthia zopfii]
MADRIRAKNTSIKKWKCFFAIQAADFIANAIYTKYEFENEYFYKLFNQQIIFHNLFPPSNFGKPYSE